MSEDIWETCILTSPIMISKTAASRSRGHVSSFPFGSCEIAVGVQYSILDSFVQEMHWHSREDVSEDHRGDKEFGAHEV